MNMIVFVMMFTDDSAKRRLVRLHRTLIIKKKGSAKIIRTH